VGTTQSTKDLNRSKRLKEQIKEVEELLMGLEMRHPPASSLQIPTGISIIDYWSLGL
jgi:hypothetical protein